MTTTLPSSIVALPRTSSLCRWASGVLSTLVLLVVMGVPAFAEGGAGDAKASTFPWETNYDVAKKKASASGKDIFIHFTGSDWCHYCKVMDEKVFSDATFQKEATKHFVFLYLDFPDSDKAAKERVVDPRVNEQLRQEFLVEGFPTFVMTSADGSPYSIGNYQGGAVSAFLKTLGAHHANGRRIKPLLLAGEKKVTLPILKSSVVALRNSQFFEYPPYAWVHKAIRRLDPKNQNGLLTHVLAFEEANQLFDFLDAKNWVGVERVLTRGKHMSDETFFGGAFRLAVQYKCMGQIATSRQWIQRLQAKPRVRSNKAMQTAITKLKAELDAMAKTPAAAPGG